MTKIQTYVLDSPTSPALFLPVCGTCVSAHASVSPGTSLTVVPAVTKIQFKGPNNEVFADVTGTLYVLKDTPVTFKAIPNPPNAVFPTGKPIWSGTSGASGTGETASVSFSTISSGSNDFKTVIASVGDGATATVNIIVYNLIGALNPQIFFTGRSTTRYGLREKVNAGFLMTPIVSSTQAGGLMWKVVSGSVTFDGSNTGADTFTAVAIPGSVTLKLTIMSGPSKGLGPQFDKDIVAPSSAYMMRSSEQPSFRHCRGFSSVGFYGEARIEPKDVAFTNLFFREGGGTMVATGYYASANGDQHPPTGFMTPITDCNAATGCKGFIDQVYTGAWPPDPTQGFFFGDATWPIDWLYAFENDLGPGVNGQTKFTVAVHFSEADNLGTASIQKAGAGPFSRMVDDPDENCQ